MNLLHPGRWLAASFTLSMAAVVAAPTTAPTPEALRQLSRPVRETLLRNLVNLQAADRQRAQPEGMEDWTPPRLAKITVAGRSGPGAYDMQQAPVDIAVNDDWSGLDWGVITAYSLTGGGWTMVDIPATFGGRRFVGTLGLPLPPGSAPGTWRVAEVYGADVNGNYYYYGESELSAFGDLSFQVKPRGEADYAPPELLSGRITTPVIHQSVPAKGTAAQGPFARAELTISDATDASVSGVKVAEMAFCQRDSGSCFYLATSWPDSIAYGLKKATLLVGQPDMVGYAPGEYRLKDVFIYDWAGNGRSYTAIEFGGETDFGAMFGGAASIVLKP